MPPGMRAGADFRFPGGESLQEHSDRVWEALEDIRAAAPAAGPGGLPPRLIRAVLCRSIRAGWTRSMSTTCPTPGWSRCDRKRLPQLAFAVLALATLGAFFLIQPLKTANPLLCGPPLRSIPAAFNPLRRTDLQIEQRASARLRRDEADDRNSAAPTRSACTSSTPTQTVHLSPRSRRTRDEGAPLEPDADGKVSKVFTWNGVWQTAGGAGRDVLLPDRCSTAGAHRSDLSNYRSGHHAAAHPRILSVTADRPGQARATHAAAAPRPPARPAPAPDQHVHDRHPHGHGLARSRHRGGPSRSTSRRPLSPCLDLHLSHRCIRQAGEG